MTAKKRIVQLGLGVAAAALLAAVQPCSASAQDVLFPETIQVQKYTGTFQKEFHIDIDSDGEKEAIGYYYVGSKRDGYSISDVYSVFDTNSESYILYRRISNDHMNYKFHIIQDKIQVKPFSDIFIQICLALKCCIDFILTIKAN